MEIRVYTLPGGKLQIMVDGEGVNFDQAKAATAVILNQLKAQGLAVEATSEVESHREGVEHVHEVHQHHTH